MMNSNLLIGKCSFKYLVAVVRSNSVELQSDLCENCKSLLSSFVIFRRCVCKWCLVVNNANVMLSDRGTDWGQSKMPLSWCLL